MGDNMDKEKFWKIYNEERDKLSYLPDMDDDIIALDKAIEIYNKETDEKISYSDFR